MISFLFSFDVKLDRTKSTTYVRLLFIEFLLLIFLGLRGFVSTDWREYYPFYETCPDFSRIGTLKTFNYNYGQWEYGFLLLSSFFKTLNINYFTWIFINTFVDIIVYHIFFSKYVKKNLTLCFIFFILFNGFNIEINLLRNSKAFILFLLSIKYLKKGENKINYYLLNILGCFFHISSIIYLAIGLIIDKEWNRKLLFLLFCLFNILSILNIDFISILINLIAKMFLPQRFIFLVSCKWRGWGPVIFEKFFF